MAKVRTVYKNNLPPSWQKIAAKNEFLLGDSGKSWRWGRKNGQFYYDIERIPDRKPQNYRSSLPSPAELISIHKGKVSKGKTFDLHDIILTEVGDRTAKECIDFFLNYKIGDKYIFNREKSLQMARAAAWLTVLRDIIQNKKFVGWGFSTLHGFLADIVDLISRENLEGLRIRTPESLRKKISSSPEAMRDLCRSLVSGKYCNDNARKLGRHKIVDENTGEIYPFDEHQAVIMNYWLNPGSAVKLSKRQMWELYCRDMQGIGLQPLKISTFNRYTNSWTNKVLSARERHGSKYSCDKYRPYIPSANLTYANTLWAADGSGLIPYRYRTRDGRWKMMKLYVVLVSDVASRYIAGWSVSAEGTHREDPDMVRDAVRKALRNNGTTEVLEFISDNHGAFTSQRSVDFLRTVFRRVRTITPGNAKANPAELMFRLFKRQFKALFRLPETSWDALSAESKANPDYYSIDRLPVYNEAIQILTDAIGTWNDTMMANGIVPARWFHQQKNPKAGKYDGRLFRYATGNHSIKDLSQSRGVLTVEKDRVRYRFEIPVDADSFSKLAVHLRSSGRFIANVHWDEHGADIYTEDGIYILSCPPLPVAHKSVFEADGQSMAALSRHRSRQREFERSESELARSAAESVAAIASRYGYAHTGKRIKEQYNNMAERRSEELLARPPGTKVLFPAASVPDAIDFHRQRITDINKYKL